MAGARRALSYFGARSIFARALRPAPALLSALLFSALLASGCTFERRPQPADSPEETPTSSSASEESARRFLGRLRVARISGELDEVRALLHPEATVLLDGRILSLEGEPTGEARAEAWSILSPRSGVGVSPGAGGGAPADTVEASIGSGAPEEVPVALSDSTAFFLIRYPPPARIAESVLLFRDDSDWRLRVLHRVTLEE